MDTELEYLYQEIIKEHSKNPQNNILTHDLRYKQIHLNNPSCGDEITIEIFFDGDIIKDIRQSGHGCMISMASASIASEILKGHNVVSVKKIIEKFYGLVQGDDVDEEELGDARAMRGVSKFPMRVKCATLAWKACEKILSEK